jgi:hypothetical protein
MATVPPLSQSNRSSRFEESAAAAAPRPDRHPPPPPPDIHLIPWYHYQISRHVAESVLMSTGEDGSYLLRDSNTNLGEFTLSVRAKNSVKHFPVRWGGSEFTFGFGKFQTVCELLEHFESKPVIGGESGNHFHNIHLTSLDVAVTSIL